MQMEVQLPNNGDSGAGPGSQGSTWDAGSAPQGDESRTALPGDDVGSAHIYLSNSLLVALV